MAEGRKGKAKRASKKMGIDLETQYRKVDMYERLKIIPDIVRFLLILSSLGFVFYLIFTADIWGAIIWAILWLPIGFIILLNVFGFLTLPLYMLLSFILNKIYGEWEC